MGYNISCEDRKNHPCDCWIGGQPTQILFNGFSIPEPTNGELNTIHDEIRSIAEECGETGPIYENVMVLFKSLNTSKDEYEEQAARLLYDCWRQKFRTSQLYDIDEDELTPRVRTKLQNKVGDLHYNKCLNCGEEWSESELSREDIESLNF